MICEAGKHFSIIFIITNNTVAEIGRVEVYFIIAYYVLNVTELVRG